ncbi:MAG: alpha/beta hydrolase [Candidatus Hydrogenedentales bacterium]
MNRLWPIARRALLLVAIVLAGLYAVFFLAQTSLLFQGERGLSSDPRAKGWNFEDVTVSVGSHTTHGWYLPVENARGAVLFCHGSGGNIATHLEATRLFRSLGCSSLIFDCGGSGKSTGGPSESRCYADARAMWDWLVETRGVPPSDIVIWGNSFGGGTACDLAAKVKPAALVLESTYLSLPEAAHDGLSWFPWGLFMRYRFANKDKIGKVQAPVLIIHSVDDTQYPIRHGRGLFEHANAPKTMIETRGDHYDTGVSKKSSLPKIEAFLEPVLGPQVMQKETPASPS